MLPFGSAYPTFESASGCSRMSHRCSSAGPAPPGPNSAPANQWFAMIAGAPTAWMERSALATERTVTGASVRVCVPESSL